jgi:hypothetical protein
MTTTGTPDIRESASRRRHTSSHPVPGRVPLISTMPGTFEDSHLSARGAPSAVETSSPSSVRAARSPAHDGMSSSTMSILRKIGPTRGSVMGAFESAHAPSSRRTWAGESRHRDHEDVIGILERSCNPKTSADASFGRFVVNTLQFSFSGSVCHLVRTGRRLHAGIRWVVPAVHVPFGQGNVSAGRLLLSFGTHNHSSSRVRPGR